MFIVLGLF